MLVHSPSWVLPADGVLLVVAVMDEDHHNWVLVGREVFHLCGIFLNSPISFFIISSSVALTATLKRFILIF